MRPAVSRMRTCFLPSRVLQLTHAVTTCAVLTLAPAALAQVIEPPFDQDYALTSFGSVAGVPGNYGGLAFLRGNADVLLIGGNANQASADVYTVTVVRDASSHIIGFQTDAAPYAETPYIDGGLTYGPGDVLFYTRYPEIEIGQILPGSSVTDKVVDLEVLGMDCSPGGAQFVPGGFPGAGKLKVACYGPDWFSASVVVDPNGTYDVIDLSQTANIGASIEGFAFAPAGSPQLTDFGTVMIHEYLLQRISAFDLDSNGDPIPATRRVFATGIAKPVGMAFDPISGDLIVSSFNGVCYAIRGFSPPCSQDATWSNYGAGWPGTLGVPSFTCSADPVIGSTFDVTIGNSSGIQTVGVVFVGFEAATIPTTAGGTIHLLWTFLLPVPLAPGGLTLGMTLPADDTLCGLPVYAQVLMLDDGASHGIAFTEGLSLILGN